MPILTKACRTLEEFEEKLKELQEQAPDEHRPEPFPFLYRGQENACWPVKTTLEQWSDGREMSFQNYYESIYRAKPAIESYTKKRWDIPDPPDVGHLTERVEPFARFTLEHFRYLGSSLELHGALAPSWVSLTFPRLDSFTLYRGLLRFPAADQGRGKEGIYFRLLRNAKSSQCIPRATLVTSQRYTSFQSNTSPTHQRHFLQQGGYTICVQNRESEWRFVPHKHAFGRGDPNIDVIWQFNLPATERLKVLKLLDRSNINAFSLFQFEESLLETMAFRELDRHRL